LPAVDVIELYNPTASDVNIGGWFLTDNFDDPKKFVIPTGTMIPAGMFKTFSEEDFNVGPRAFALSSKGEEVYLFSGDGVNLTGYEHGFDFGPAANSVTFGRYVISTGQDHFVAQVANSLNSANAGPRVGPVAVTEVMYHPPDVAFGTNAFNNTDDEYIELQNISGQSVALYDINHPTNTWRLTDAVDYSFPPGVMMPPGSYLLLVNFNPFTNAAALDAFRARNLVPDTVPVYGPWQGDLGNDRDRVELRRPDTPETNTLDVPYILVERVHYGDAMPWPGGADGLGLSLQRVVPSSYGNDPSNYVASAPTPGAPFVGGGVPPTILSQPGNQLLVTGRDAMFSVTATGTPPLRYQWRFQGIKIADATNSTLVLRNVQPDNQGVYNVLVFNNGGSALSSNFVITTRIGLQITQQPQNRFVRPGANTNFTVSAVGTGTLRYQWRRNGVNIPNAFGATLSLTNVQAANEGQYSVEVQDNFDTLVSNPATLTLIFVPDLTLQPISQTAVEGSSISFSTAATGTTPIGFRWRKGGVTFAGGLQIGSLSNSTLVLTNVRVPDATNYTVIASNIAGTSRVSSNAFLTLLLDSDQDGIPDLLEPIDGGADTDGDGMTNAEEYLAGTDYLDPRSYLRVDITAGGGAVLMFNAVSNRSYTVQYTDGLSPALWRRFLDVLALTNTRSETVVDPSPGPNRVYRLVTPVQP
jgi:hypothetical protein